jgi:hypothetical protein
VTPVLVRIAASVFAVAALTTACSSGGGKHSASHSRACVVIASLDQAAVTAARADVSDPVAFKKALDAGVARYVFDLQVLKPLVPADVQVTLDRVAGDVQQLRFQDATTDRAALDAYAASHCGRAPLTTTTH